MSTCRHFRPYQVVRSSPPLATVTPHRRRFEGARRYSPGTSGPSCLKKLDCLPSHADDSWWTVASPVRNRLARPSAIAESFLDKDGILPGDISFTTMSATSSNTRSCPTSGPLLGTIRCQRALHSPGDRRAGNNPAQGTAPRNAIQTEDKRCDRAPASLFSAAKYTSVRILEKSPGVSFSGQNKRHAVTLMPERP